MIERFIDQYRWLSNFWEVEISYQGITYPSVEHYYVAMKVNEVQEVNVIIDGKEKKVYLDVPELREYISNIETSSKVKRFGREEIKERGDWSDIKVSIMEFGLKQKYNQEPFKTKLLETGDDYIQEGNTWNDTFWGVDIDSGKGKNVLGKLIMKIREKIRENE